MTLGLQIVSLGTHGLHYLFPFVGNLLLKAVGILSLSNYAWTVRLQIVSCDTHGLHYLFPFVENFLLEAVGLLSLSNYA